jgi:hypothetical protein
LQCSNHPLLDANPLWPCRYRVYLRAEHGLTKIIEAFVALPQGYDDGPALAEELSQRGKGWLGTHGDPRAINNFAA